MISLAACVTGFFLDIVFGDPVWLYHPVRMIGAWISFLEKHIRRLCGESQTRRLLWGGALLWVLVVLVSVSIPLLLLWLAGQIHWGLRYILESFWCFQILAATSLRRESKKVYEELKAGRLNGARRAVSMIVGRDTEALDEKGVTKAAVETVAENTSDGEAAPLFYLILGGAPLGFFYKAVNTMDSMVGYKNEKYRYFGTCAARLDDAANFIPARLSALFMTAAAFLAGYDGKNAWRILKRDRKKHKSPNAAHTEAVMAGALDVQLAGDAWYFGKLVRKPFIGDGIRPIERQDIRRACRLEYATALLQLLVLGALKAAVLFML